jgi:MFS transporter, DHA3 family, macrolide efflux protein
MEIKQDPGLGKKWKRDFFTVVGGQTVSLLGSSAVQFALIWWLASETGSALMLSLAGLLVFLPQFFLGPFAGVWIDRLKRKNVIIAADLFTGLAAAAFALSFLIWNPPYWLACVVIGVRAIATVFHMPALQAAMPLLVPKEELLRANGWSQFLQSGAFMIGPILGAAMYAAWPMPAILLSDLIGAIIASAAIATVNMPEIAAAREKRHFFNEVKEGVKVFFKDRRLFIVTTAATACMVFFLPLAIFYPLMTSDYFKATAWHAGLVEFLYAAGMMFGAAAIAKLGAIKDKLGAVHAGLFALGLTSLFCGLLPQTMAGFWIFAALCLAMGASGNLFNIPYTAYMQETIPPSTQGRAFSFIGSLMSVTMPIGLIVAGPAAERYGVIFWFLVAGAAMMAITAISALATAAQRRAASNKD